LGHRRNGLVGFGGRLECGSFSCRNHIMRTDSVTVDPLPGFAGSDRMGA